MDDDSKLQFALVKTKNNILTESVGNPNPTVYKTLDVTVDSLNGYRMDSSEQ